LLDARRFCRFFWNLSIVPVADHPDDVITSAIEEAIRIDENLPESEQ